MSKFNLLQPRPMTVKRRRKMFYWEYEDLCSFLLVEMKRIT